MSGLLVAAQGDDGARVSLSDCGELALSERTPAGSIVTRLTREQIPGVLGARSGLEGFALGPDGRIVSAR